MNRENNRDRDRGNGRDRDRDKDRDRDRDKDRDRDRDKGTDKIRSDRHQHRHGHRDRDSSVSSSSDNEKDQERRKERRKERRIERSVDTDDDDNDKSSRHHRSKKKKKRRDKSSDLKLRTMSAINKLEREYIQDNKKEEDDKSIIYHGYTNDANPFNDPHLSSAFIWKKKYESAIEQHNDNNSKGKKSSSSLALPLTKEELRLKQLSLRSEIAEVKKRREEREEEKQQMLELREAMDRRRDAESIEGWEEKEEEFHRQQSKLKTKIRMKEGREKAIDMLIKNVALQEWIEEEEKQRSDREKSHLSSRIQADMAAKDAKYGFSSLDIEIELSEPYSIFIDLSLSDLQDLHSDLKYQLELGEHIEYWQSLIILCREEILKASGAKQINESIHADIRQSIHQMLEGKSKHQLDRLDHQIHTTLNKQSHPHLHKDDDNKYLLDVAVVDVVYWESVLRELQLYRCRAYLKEFHAEILRKRLNQLKKQIEQEKISKGEKRKRKQQQNNNEENDENQKHISTYKAEATNIDDEEDFEPRVIRKVDFHGDLKDDEEYRDNSEERGERESKRLKDNPSRPGMDDMQTQRESFSSFSSDLYSSIGSDLPKAVSPRLFGLDEDVGMEVVNEIDDMEELESNRRIIAEQKSREEVERRERHGREEKGGVSADMPSSFSSSLAVDSSIPVGSDDSSSIPVGGDEVIFRHEISLPSQSYVWHDKYRPRKPRYFNRVKTGFDWNKYNQTHYSKENPPPKIVQGYKFNIFYPDLIDPLTPPKYKIERVPGEKSEDYCIIRFIAGPPYEDVAFKIVRKEWEYNPKRGFRYDKKKSRSTANLLFAARSLVENSDTSTWF